MRHVLKGEITFKTILCHCERMILVFDTQEDADAFPTVHGPTPADNAYKVSREGVSVIICQDCGQEYDCQTFDRLSTPPTVSNFWRVSSKIAPPKNGAILIVGDDGKVTVAKYIRARDIGPHYHSLVGDKTSFAPPFWMPFPKGPQ